MSVASPERTRRCNVADRLTLLAAERPEQPAVVAAGRGAYRKTTFAELDREATLLASGLMKMGVGPGLRMALLVKPSIEFVALVFALLRSGATMVLVDSGLGVKNIVRCLESTSPDGFVGIPQAHALRALNRRKFANAKLNVTVGRRWFWGGETLASLRNLGQHDGLPHTTADDPAAIVFTSGSTGPPKGVLYRHETFVTQADEIQHQYGIQPGGIDLACFPLFGLFNVACGVTTVLPEMDFSRPASCDPKKLFRAANDWQVTQAFASPAVWDRLSRAAEESGERVPTLRKVFSCGAPVPAKVIRRTLTMVHPEAELHTPYGATESLPIATIEAKELLGETAAKTDAGAGVCVGRKFDSIEWRVIRITDDPIATIAATEELSQGEIGELIVRGPQVSREYLTNTQPTTNDPQAKARDPQAPAREPKASAPGAKNHNALAKIRDGETVWHRLGDVGYLDDQDRFWYCGRKSQRVVTEQGTLFTECVEAVFNTVPMVVRTALVGVDTPLGRIPVLVYESSGFDRVVGRAGSPEAKELQEGLQGSLRNRAQEAPGASAIEQFLPHPKLPTDIRHNSKINREKLAEWAALKLKKESSAHTTGGNE